MKLKLVKPISVRSGSYGSMKLHRVMSLITDSAAVRCRKADEDMHVRILRRDEKLRKKVESKTRKSTLLTLPIQVKTKKKGTQFGSALCGRHVSMSKAVLVLVWPSKACADLRGDDQ